MNEWFSEKLNHFLDLDDVKTRQDTLIEIRLRFGSLSANEAAVITRNLDLSRLFSRLTSNNDDDTLEQICEALCIVSQASPPAQILWQYTSELHSLLSHKLIPARIFALQEILRAASHPDSLPQLLTKLDLLVTVVETVSTEHLGTAQNAMAVLKQIGKNQDGMKSLYSGVLLRAVAKLLANDDTIKFRAYEVIVDVAKNSKEHLEASIQSGFLQSLISMLDVDDILLQLNVLEVLIELALTQEGLEFLEEQGVLANLVQKIAQAHETPLSNLLIPGLMKFFGNVARLSPNEMFSKYPVVISALFEVIQGDDQTILTVALDTLGYISSTVDGKYALESLGDSMPLAMKRIGIIIQTMPSDLRVRALNNLVQVFSLDKSDHDNRILSLIKYWFDSLCEDPLKVVLSLCKQPFADIRQASLEVLSVISCQLWAQEYIANHPGLIEFLLDRNIESFKECKELKFQIVKNLTESVPNLFDTQTMQRLKKFVSEGPFHVDSVTEVAIEGAS